MKKIFSYILIFIIGINVFGFSGNLSGENNLKIIKTQWLDIIYPENCKVSAERLAEAGDEIFIQVTKQYGLEPDFRLPVVITPTIDLYNAFYTPAPYNRIVLFDTSTQTLDDLSSSFSDNLLSTFRHELTHAVTFNMKNGFWKGFTNIFGDVMVPGNFFVTSGMAEGAAVSSESANGEGRLNDEFAKHFVKQAKIEGKFPNYYDVQGAGDNMIPGIQYYFNGPFHQWLQEKYGMEKYADFWHKVLNVSRPGVNWSFKKVYGFSIRNAWKNFAASYEIPENIKDPNTICNKINLKADGGVRYSSFSKSEKGIYFIEKYSSSVYFINEKSEKAKKILTQKGIEEASVSADGKLMAVSYYSNNEPTLTAKIKLFNCNTNQLFSVSENGIKNGRLMQWSGDYYLICHQYNSPYNRILIYKIIFDDEKIVDVEKTFLKDFPLNTFICDFTDLGNGDFAYLQKKEKNISICISDLSGNIKSIFQMPEGLSIRNLSENKGQLYFSWAKKDTMPRFGNLSPETNELLLSNEDISGGIFYPLVFNYADTQRVAFMANFYEESAIFETDNKSEIFTNCEKITLDIINKEYQFNNHLENHADSKGFLLEEDYKWYKNLYGGLFIPFSFYENDVLLPFGATFATSNPWSNGADDLLILTAGWGYATNSVGIEAIINKGTATSLFSYSLDLKTEFDKKGWKESSGLGTFSSGFNFGKKSTFILENSLSISGGRENNLNTDLSALDLLKFWDPNIFQALSPVSDTVVFNITNYLSSTYSNISKMGPGRFQFGGLMFETGIGFIYDSEYGQNLVITGSVGGKLPSLIPINQKKGLVYNLPLKFSCTLLPLASAYGKTGVNIKQAGYGVLDTNIETVLFGLDIQKAIPYFDFLFLQDFYVTAGYCSTIVSYKGSKNDSFQLPYIFEYFGNLGNGKSVYLDSVYFRLYLELCANVGVLANEMFNISGYLQVSVPLNVLPGKQKPISFNIGFESKF